MHEQKITWFCFNPIEILFLTLVFWIIISVYPKTPVVFVHSIYRHDANSIAAIAKNILPVRIELFSELDVTVPRVRNAVTRQLGVYLADNMFK